MIPENQPETEIEVADPAGFDREALETRTAAAMADIFKDADETDLPAESADETPAAKPAAEETPAKEDPAPAAVVKPVVEKQPTASASPATELPAAYVRSLKAYQWTDEEIGRAAKADPEGFLKTAERIHATRVQETQRWADLGRQAKAAPAEKAPAAPAKVDIASLRAKYGDEPFIAALEAQAAQLEAATTFITQARQQQADAALEGLTKQIDGFFGSDSLKLYQDQYGKVGSTLTDAQLGARQKVLETADLLISGARSMGRPLTLDEALTTAHDSVSSPLREQAAVAKIKTAVKTRQAAISLRPGSRAPIPAKDRSALEKTVKAGLTNIFS